MMNKLVRRAVLACLLVLVTARMAGADGGTVQMSKVVGTDRITIFTAPNPLRAGPVDVSVLVQDAASGDVRPEARVELQWSLPEEPGSELHASATQAAATNKLLRAAVFELPHAGQWELTADVAAGTSHGELSTVVTVAEPLPRWRSMWPWYSWPVVVAALFVWRQLSSGQPRAK